jgi:NlpC/P60 family putative phage cell wall peptidase
VTTRADVVAEARSWIGTPFHWQASLKGKGCDCKGLVVGVARELGMPEADNAFASIHDYGHAVPVRTLREGLAAMFDRVSEPQPGDVLLLMMAGQPQHVGIHAGDVLIHTYAKGPQRVISTALPVALRAWPLVSAWRFRSVSE